MTGGEHDAAIELQPVERGTAQGTVDVVHAEGDNSARHIAEGAQRCVGHIGAIAGIARRDEDGIGLAFDDEAQGRPAGLRCPRPARGDRRRQDREEKAAYHECPIVAIESAAV